MTEWILSSSVLILIVIALRACFKGKINLRLQYAIWGLVLLRLLIPISFGSTNFSVANLASKTETPTILVQLVEHNEIIHTDHLVQVPQAQPENDTLQAAIQNEPAKTAKNIDLRGYALNIIWAVGFVSVAGLFLITNTRFKRRIIESRYKMDVRKNNLDVYATGAIDTPCLFGLKNPAIYVTYPVADNQTLLRHTLEHEATHHRHGDHIWAVLRCVCLTIHWYNPLVWWAAFLSQRDAELACDEATIKRLGEGERAEYGRTLIGMTCQKKANVLITATTMNSGKSGLRERIMLIAKKPKMALYTLLVVVLVASIAVGCTFTGAKTNEAETDGQGARGEILDENGEVLISKDLEGETTPAETTEATEFATEHIVMGVPDDAPPANIPEMLHDQLDPNKVCIAVMPTSLATSGENWYYIIPENQELLLEYYQAAAASATKLSWDNDVKQLGWKILYQDEWWTVKENGSILCDLYGDRSIASEDAKELYTFCRDAVKEAGIGEPVRPEDITEIKSATLYWNGTHTLTDEYALNKIEKWIANSREEGSVSCWFTAQLTLELENGETKTIAMATDSCATWMSEGVSYGFGEITAEGINGNEEFYSLFAPAVIHEKSKEGMDAVNEFIIYLNWSSYANQYGVDETFALIDMIEKWAEEEPTYNRFGGAIGWTAGLDGVYADYYAAMLARLYELAPSEFAWACLGNAFDTNETNTLEMLAYHWNMTPEEVRAKLESDRN